jgi:type VI secretion system protein ImpB
VSESIQKWLGRNRPPRVHITYDVETRGAIVKKELPFIVGILADLSGENTPEIGLKERKFIEIDRDNFGEVMATVAPGLTVKVPDELAAAAEAEGDEKAKEGEEDAGAMLVAPLSFRKLDDFRPENVAGQIADLSELLEGRRALVDLAAQIDLRDGLAEMLHQIITSSEDEQKKLQGDAETALTELASDEGGEGAGEEKE